jgi:DNA uptake protein ComE-like DNA-binding protein
MKLNPATNQLCGRATERASVLIIVLWICIGLVTIALYFANSMTYELRAADNRVSGIAADQAIEGAARYVSNQLQNYTTNGLSVLPDSTQFPCANVPIGDAHFWIIGRDPEGASSTEPYFGLVDEASKLNLNYANTNALSYLPNMTLDFAQAISDWRSTNGSGTYDYASAGYTEKNATFETEDELRLVSGANLSLLVGDDLNRNGVRDANEKDTAGSGQVNSGLFEYTTVYTREPNFRFDGTTLTNLTDINTASQRKLTSLFEAANVSTSFIRPVTNGIPYAGMLALAVGCRRSGMSDSDFYTLSTNLTTTNATYIRGRVNVNTASEAVLSALFEGLNNGDETTADSDAQTLITYREQNTNNLGSLAWVYDALGTGNSTLTRLDRGDYLTTHSYQITADIAAVGAFGRGYRRVRFVFDLSNGTPIILYRQDLSRLGWALGGKARQTLLANDSP